MSGDNAIDLAGDGSVHVEFGAGRIARLGELARAEGATRVLLVTDPGIEAAGHVDRAIAALTSAPVGVTLFDGARENPTTEHVAAGLAVAKQANVDFIVGLGGGSAMDCAKGVNLLLSCGGRMADYRGDPGAEALAGRPPLRPMILVPTTAGTGSEAQSFALITDAVSKDKMACGDRRAVGGLRPRASILDPALLRTCPRGVAAAAGIDAVAHAVETAGCRVRSAASRALSRRAWALLNGALERVMAGHGAAGGTDDGWGDMLLGAHIAGAAIEASMLGAAHACANPLTARCGITHGVAVGVMLPHVVRFNAGVGPYRAASDENPYADLEPDAERLAGRVEQFLDGIGIARRLGPQGVGEGALPALAVEAARQWTATFNPRSVAVSDFLCLYQSAF